MVGATTFREKDRAMTRPRRFLLSFAVSAAVVLSAGWAAAQLTGADREAFVQAAIASCTATATKNHPDVAAATIKTYCTCMAGKEADITTAADIAYMNEHNAATPEYTSRVQALAPACNAAAGLH
jgi:hypothetical protein